MEKELQNRMEELAARSLEWSCYTHSHFLTEGEQNDVRFLSLPLRPRFVGGFEGAERCVALFGTEEELGYPWEGELVLLRIAPKDPKFADPLTHRDFLGAILHLGLKREMLGDIVVFENCAYVAVLSRVTEVIGQELCRVRHTAVTVETVKELPEGAGQFTRETEVVCASERLDAVLCGLWNLSRADGKELVDREKVSVAGKVCTDAARLLREGERVSVRGYGRFLYGGEKRKTGSGKSRVILWVYQ